MLLGVASAIVAVSYLVLFWQEISPEECLRLEKLKNVAVGQLENSTLKSAEERRLGEADAAFAEIAERLPSDPLGHRNLAIARITAFENALSDERDPAAKAKPFDKAANAARAQAAISGLMAAERESAVAHLLAARLAKVLGDKNAALAEARTAAELAPDDPTMWYEVYDASNSFTEKFKEIREEGRKALTRAHELAPTNISILGWLAYEQAHAKDEGVVGTLKRLREAAPWILIGLGTTGKSDYELLLDQGLDAALRGDWKGVWTPAIQFNNSFKGLPIVQADLRRIHKNNLEFVLYEFGSRYCPRGEEIDEPAVDINVSLAPVPLGRPLGNMSGILDLHLADFDLDSRLDLILLGQNRIEVFSRGKSGDAWRRIARYDHKGKFIGLVVVDLDQDDPDIPAVRKEKEMAPAAPIPDGAADKAEPEACGYVADVDVVLFGPAGLVVLENTLDTVSNRRTLVRVPQSRRFDSIRGVYSATAVDMYHDGDLDLVLGTQARPRVWSNRGNMTFFEITSRSQLPKNLGIPTPVAVDLNRDVDLDLVFASPSIDEPGYLENIRHGRMRWQSLGSGFDALRGARGLAVFEADGDVSWDLAAAGDQGVAVIHMATSMAGGISASRSAQLVDGPRTGVRSWDYDNDGYVDLVTWGRTALEVFRGRPGGAFELAAGMTTGPRDGLSDCRIGDLDGDGDQDLALLENGRPLLYSNEGGNQNKWVDYELRAGLVDAQGLSFRINQHALGSLLEIRTGRRYQAQTVAGQISHFGLGQASMPDLARVIWTSGVPQSISVVPVPKRIICEEQIIKGSCPYLYTWDGERFVFCTDCLWAAPMGLQLADGVFSPSRAWEYLRVGGDQLKPKDGKYALRITEELWEAVYLDQVKLIAVDHPSDVEVYSNEKVGPAEIAQFHVHTVRRPRVPVSARDQHGRDVLAQVRDRDGVYLRPFDRRLGPGLAEEHFLQLDLGQLKGSKRITLFLSGWIFPSGTSMNVGLSQHPAYGAPRPPAVLVPDALGEWKEVIPYMGFPGGKTKTIAIDLSNSFLADDYRLRIGTTMEIYWDQVFFTADEEPAQTRLTELALERAELRYRGFSRRIEGKSHGPEDYDYDRVRTEPVWPPMDGAFTRYGPVENLLSATDDLMVVMGAGDEVALEFSQGTAPPKGWSRDFMMYNVGWDKDADLNTADGQTVEPLPFGAMSGYPYPPSETYPSLAVHRDYLDIYQTRRQHPAEFWRRLSRPELNGVEAER